MSSGVQGMHFRFFALGTKEIVLRPAETKLLIDPSKASGIAFILPQIINRVADKAMIAPVITSTRHPLQGCRTPIRPDGLTKISRAWQGGCNGSFINPQILNCGKQGLKEAHHAQSKGILHPPPGFLCVVPTGWQWGRHQCRASSPAAARNKLFCNHGWARCCPGKALAFRVAVNSGLAATRAFPFTRLCIKSNISAGASWHAYSQLKIFHMIWVSKKQKQKYRAWEGAGSMFAYVDEKVPSNHLEIVFLWTGVDQLGELLCPAADFWQPSTWRHRGTYSLLELPVSK
eukprot:1144451-Pelagomonas_calceolata.AAC.7